MWPIYNDDSFEIDEDTHDESCNVIENERYRFLDKKVLRRCLVFLFFVRDLSLFAALAGISSSSTRVVVVGSYLGVLVTGWCVEHHEGPQVGSDNETGHNEGAHHAQADELDAVKQITKHDDRFVETIRISIASRNVNGRFRVVRYQH